MLIFHVTCGNLERFIECSVSTRSAFLIKAVSFQSSYQQAKQAFSWPLGKYVSSINASPRPTQEDMLWKAAQTTSLVSEICKRETKQTSTESSGCFAEVSRFCSQHLHDSSLPFQSKAEAFISFCTSKYPVANPQRLRTFVFLRGVVAL